MEELVDWRAVLQSSSVGSVSSLGANAYSNPVAPVGGVNVTVADASPGRTFRLLGGVLALMGRIVKTLLTV